MIPQVLNFLRNLTGSTFTIQELLGKNNWTGISTPFSTQEMADRRRINGPSCGTAPPLFMGGGVSNTKAESSLARTRPPNVIRKIC